MFGRARLQQTMAAKLFCTLGLVQIPPPTPVPAASPPALYTLPPDLVPPAPLPYQWGAPLAAISQLPSNDWRGYPDYAVPASEGGLYLIAGFAHHRLDGESWATYYMVNYFGWENPLTDQRDSGGAADSGPALNDDYAFQVDSVGLTWPASHLNLSLASIAPSNTQGVHLDVHAGGSDKAPSEGDPVDTRSGTFYLTEQDFGVETGCPRGLTCALSVPTAASA